MQVFVVESLYCRENATKKSASADFYVILIYSLFLFLYQKEQVSPNCKVTGNRKLPTTAQSAAIRVLSRYKPINTAYREPCS